MPAEGTRATTRKHAGKAGVAKAHRRPNTNNGQEPPPPPPSPPNNKITAAVRNLRKAEAHAHGGHWNTLRTHICTQPNVPEDIERSEKPREGTWGPRRL